jgi:hypothetical protein
MSTIENVVYTYEPDDNPAIRYHSIPSSFVGAAETLAEARSSYRSDLTGLLHVDRHGLPPVVEHVEAVVAGMRVRTKVGAVHRDRTRDRMFLQTLLAPGGPQDEIREYLDTIGTAGIDPVVVLAEPEDPIASVLDQMTPQDAVVVTYPDADAVVGWAAIYGPQAPGVHDDLPSAPLDPAVREMPIEAFTDAYALTRHRRAVRVCPNPLPEAC